MDFLSTFLHRLYHAAQRRYPDVLYYGSRARREIALTFDDGPHPQDTPPLLDVLEKHRVRATFHLVGKGVERHPDLIRYIHQSGHQLALHAYRHIPLSLERPARLGTTLAYTQNLIAGAAGVAPATIRDLRPPYGLFTARTLSQLLEWGFRPVMWSCILPHWMQPVSWSIRQVMEALVPGVVIVLHDGHGHGRQVSEIVDAIIPRIRSRGFDFVTIDEMQAKRKELEKEKVTI